MTAPPRPPRPPRWISRAAIPDARWRETTLGDLSEEFATMAALRGRVRARLWYARQLAGLLAASLWRGSVALLHARGDGFMRTWMYDTKIAVRSLLHRPLVALIVLVTLALGLGANAATFNMIDALILRPFPIRDVDRLVIISENSPADPYPTETVSRAAYEDFRRDATSFARLAAFRGWDVNLAGAGVTERIDGQRVTPDFFHMLGATPALGRLFEPSDLVLGRHHQVVISDGLWRRAFGGRTDVVGLSVRVDGVPHEIVGVAPRGFAYPGGTEVWGPLATSPAGATNRTLHDLTIVAELAPGASFDSAQSEIAALYDRQKAAYPEGTRGRQAVVRTFSAAMTDVGMPQVLSLWQAAAAFVLLIGCLNVASLLIARAAERQHELAVRVAIGASRGQIARQLLIESLVMALAAVPAALAVAFVALRFVQASMPASLVKYVAGWSQLGVDARVMLFTAGLAVAASLVFGLLPAVLGSRVRLTAAITDGSRAMSAGRSRTRLRRGLVIAEIALVLPLLVVSALSAIAAHRFAGGPQGYDPDGVIRMRMLLPEAQYPDAAARSAFVDRLREAVTAVPGIDDMATSSVVPALSTNQSRAITIDGVPDDPDAPRTASFRSISPGYLQTMRIPLTSGRTIGVLDRSDSQRVALVSQSFVERHFAGGAPLGRRVRIGAGESAWATVVGVTGDVIDDWFANRRPPTIYVPVAQMPTAAVTLVVRAKGDPAALAGPLRAAVAHVDPSVPPFSVMTMRDALHERTTGLRFIASLMAAFAAIALVLAACGIYGIMAHFAVARRHEMGVRMALGATSRQILRLTLGQAMRLTLAGLVLGLTAAVALARLMESALFGIVAAEPSLFVAITLALAAVAFLASVLPARRAASVNVAGLLRR